MILFFKIIILLYILYTIYYIRKIILNRHLPKWANKERLGNEYKERYNETIFNLLFIEGICTFILWPFLYICQYKYRKVKYLFYSDWYKMEEMIDDMVDTIKDFDSYDTVLGVHFGGALMADYIQNKYSNIKKKAYIRPYKKRSKNLLLFWFQILYSYLNVFFYILTNNKSPKSTILPYYTNIVWIDNMDKTNIKKILIVDDGLLSGSTSIACIDFCESYFKNTNIKFKMYVLHGFPKKYKNKLHVFQFYQLCYFPWGQT